MTPLPHRVALVGLAALALGFAGCALPSSSPVPMIAERASVSADSPHFRFDGRIDFADRRAPVFVWQSSRAVLNFSGDSLVLRFDDAKGQNCFDATIDGRTSLVVLNEGQAPVGTDFIALGAGPHSLVLTKRTEAASGTVRFRGVTLAAGGATTPASAAPSVRWMFFGDSITAGACNEDGAADQWEDRRTHNNCRSYAALTAAAFPVDYRNIAVSGMGVCEGYVEVRAGDQWDRLYPGVGAPRATADLAAWVPDVVFVNLGENDDSFTNNQHRAFPAGYRDGFVALVRAMRKTWPNAQVVILRGGMFGGAKSERLRGPWAAAVAELEQTDPKVTHFVFEHWSQTHPRVVDTEAMARELTAWLRCQPFAAGLR